MTITKLSTHKYITLIDRAFAREKTAENVRDREVQIEILELRVHFQQKRRQNANYPEVICSLYAKG
jgi:hypothetical protein